MSQLCAGQDSAAIHATCELFNHPDTEAFLLIDTPNALSSLARQIALLNIQELCICIKFLWNSLITKGTTQGNPMGMPMCALGALPLIYSLDTS